MSDAHALAAAGTAGAALGEEEPPALRHLVAENAAEEAPHCSGSGPTRTSIFPTFSPVKSARNASGARSIPSTTVSR
jgi:hypothetical protein